MPGLDGDELEQLLFNQSPKEALAALINMEITKLGASDYTLAIKRLYKRLEYMQDHGYPPEENNVFWLHVQREADELGLSSVEHMRRAMSHIQNSSSSDAYQCVQFEIQFMTRSAAWWKKLRELNAALEEILGCSVALDMVKRILSDTALDKLTDPRLVEELTAEHLAQARRHVLECYQRKGQVTTIDYRAYSDLGFKIGDDGWIKQITPTM